MLLVADARVSRNLAIVSGLVILAVVFNIVIFQNTVRLEKMQPHEQKHDHIVDFLLCGHVF